MSTNPMNLKVLASFAAVYLIWGSTYLAIRWGVETIPPFLLAGFRFTIAGLILGVWALLRGAEMPKRRHWGSATLVGALLMCGGNGLVTWTEQTVPSGIAALVITSVPLWMVVLDSVLFRAARPGPWAIGGLLVGFAGVALLDLPSSGEARTASTLGVLLLVLASLSWALGSLLSRRVPLPRSIALTTGMEMLVGGLIAIAVGTFLGEWPQLDLSQVSSTSAWSFVYLILFGSIVALSAYQWLLRATSAAAVSTYAFVNPIVAVSLGALLAHEVVTDRTIQAAVLIVGAVAAIHFSRVRISQATRNSKKRAEILPRLPRIDRPLATMTAARRPATGATASAGSGAAPGSAEG